MSTPNAGAPQKKGMSPIAIVLIVVACLVVVGGVVLVAAGWFVFNRVQEAAGGSEMWEQNPALAAARVALSMSPDIEVLDADPDSGTLRVRNKDTGEEITVDLDDIRNGNIRWSTSGGDSGSLSASEGVITGSTDGGSSSGTFQLGGDEVADPPEGVPACDGCSFRGVATSNRGAAQSGVLSFNSSRTPDELAQDYAQRLESAGYSDINTMNASGTHFVTGQRGNSTITLNATAGEDSASSGNLTFNIEQ